MDIGRRLIALKSSNITIDHEKIDAYEGGPSSLITSICIMRTAFLLVGKLNYSVKLVCLHVKSTMSKSQIL